MVSAARLRHTKDITSVRANGLARNDKHLSIRARPNTIGVVRVAVSATRDLRTAVRRNRARRRLREAVRQELHSRVSAPGMDLVIAARLPALDASGAELRASVCRMLDAVIGS